MDSFLGLALLMGIPWTSFLHFVDQFALIYRIYHDTVAAFFFNCREKSWRQASSKLENFLNKNALGNCVFAGWRLFHGQSVAGM